jgi:hypothetical protein
MAEPSGVSIIRNASRRTAGPPLTVSIGTLCPIPVFVLKEIAMDQDRAQRNTEAEQRVEREFDVITFILAAALTLILVAAIAYGVLRSSEVATTIPYPSKSSDTAVMTGVVPTATTDGSSGARNPSHSP